MYRKRDDVEIILEDIDFGWYKQDIKQVIQYWEEGLSLKAMSYNVNRSAIEVMMLLMHLERKKRITRRKGWIWGSSYKMQGE